jgi:hypothetical protein
MIETETMTETNFTYFVGDLCYVLTDNEWDTVCATVPMRGEMLEAIESDDGYDCDFFLNPHEDMFSSAEGYEAAKQFVCFSTAYGDGVYNDLDGNPYSVDSGTIGMIRTDYITDKAKLERALELGLGHVITADSEIDPTECSYGEGVISFGSMHSCEVVIDTAG